jgi:DNA-directed RNA polymerase specialized sigma24 family protein
MTTILPPPLGSQLSPGNQMNDTPAESGSRQRDLELQKLVLAIKNSPNQQDRETRKQIDRFLREISVRLVPAKQALINKWSSIFDIQSIVADAITNTIEQVLKTIASYDPEKSKVMKWIEMILNSRFHDLLRKYRAPYESESLDNPNGSVEAKVQEKIDKDDAIVDDLETESMARELREFIMEDPDGHFAGTHIRDYPDATLKKILLMRLNRVKWQEIADRFNISSHATINNFHDKQVRKLNKYFRENLCR